jgi:hypothetical protein
LQAPFLTQFRVKLQLALFYFAQQHRVPVLSPVVLFVQYLSVQASTMFLASRSVHRTPSTSFTPPLRHYASSKSQQQLQHVVAYR